MQVFVFLAAEYETTKNSLNQVGVILYVRSFSRCPHVVFFMLALVLHIVFFMVEKYGSWLSCLFHGMNSQDLDFKMLLLDMFFLPSVSGGDFAVLFSPA